ncbi:MAG: transporter [Gemmatimonadetes bacterium]|nr:transporter [Gemmatimonadota bacterium]
MAAAWLLVFPTFASGQETEPMVTDRPDFTESASTVAPGRFQFELGYTFSKAGDEERSDFGELLVRIGILSWLEGRLGLNSISLVRSPQVDQEGFQDLAIAFKAVLFRKPGGGSAAVPQVALLFGTDLPTGDSNFGANAVQPGAKLALDFSLTDRLNLGSNLGWAYLASGEERFHQGVGSVVLGYAISEPVTVYFEWYGLFPENRGGGADHYLNGGLTWGLTANLQLDWRIGAGLQDPNPNWFTGVGLSFRL